MNQDANSKTERIDLVNDSSKPRSRKLKYTEKCQ